MLNKVITKELSREFAPPRELSQDELNAVSGGETSGEVTYTHTFGVVVTVEVSNGK
ncbi:MULTISPECIES: bacteriocin [Xanthomonas]|uniref:bacteriocin n=1 Tax=Xanthomonas TaxID=338 RepID=UPI000E325BF6|nr:bacteriocin [Xanthomonas campestris]MCC5094604.1 bacteriocin [Xanthomonas campestris pv. incanae]MEA9612625.1 bacteriocin [Xanthomonas campestris pv. incanae]RFF42426.1 bacteriocin [Xanthomonas campestris pv. incanae]WDJ08257.1 bacteriocin [Xanthomonas campestris pv. incanae]